MAQQGGSGPIENFRAGRRPEVRVQHHAQRLAPASQLGLGLRQPELRGPHRESTVIRQDGSHAGDDRTALGPQPLHILPRRRTGNPLTLTGSHGRAAIQGHGQLGPHPTPAAGHAGDEPWNHPPRLGLQQPALHLDTGSAQLVQSIPGHPGIGILHGGHHPAHSRLNQRIGAGPGPAMVTAGLQGHVGGSADGIPGPAQRLDLGMVLTRRPGETLPDHMLVPRQHTAHVGVGHGGITPPARQLQGARHHAGIEFGGHGGRRPAFSRRWPPAQAPPPGARSRRGIRRYPGNCGRRRQIARRQPGQAV